MLEADHPKETHSKEQERLPTIGDGGHRERRSFHGEASGIADDLEVENAICAQIDYEFSVQPNLQIEFTGERSTSCK